MEAVAQVAQRLGNGALMAKLDIKSAYRLVPVHLSDRHLLGVEWNGAIYMYVHGMLPFGLRLAPKIFTYGCGGCIAMDLEKRDVSFMDHYLDDFIMLGPPGSELCSQNLGKMLTTCRDLGVPLAAEKLEGPTQCLTFLSIEMNTRNGILRLPAEKLSCLRDLLGQWSSRNSYRRHKLESLIGSLQHACRVIKLGRAFLRRMIDVLHIPGAT